MKLTRKTILTINIIVSATVFILLSAFVADLQSGLFNFLLKINKPLNLLSINPLDLLIISGIPLWTYPLYAKADTPTARQITLVNILALLILVSTCIVAFVAIDIFVKAPSPYLPEYIVYMPFSFFPTTVLIAGVILTYFAGKLLILKGRKTQGKGA